MHACILKKTSPNFVLIENLPRLGKRRFDIKQKGMNAFLVYPLLRGKNIKKWLGKAEFYIIVPHSPQEPKKGYEERVMKVRYPNAYHYFTDFKSELLDRGFLKKIGAGRSFYSLWKIGPYTFAPYKCVWQRMANKIKACVISSSKDKFLGKKLVIPTDSTTFVPFRTLREAHYFCAMINSKLVSFGIQTYAGPGRGFGSPSILKYAKIPRFNHHNQNHQKLARLSKNAHKLAAEGKNRGSNKPVRRKNLQA